MKIFRESCVFMLLSIFLSLGCSIYASSHDYSATKEKNPLLQQRLEELQAALSGGGLVLDHEPKYGDEGRIVFRDRARASEESNKFIVVHNRTQSVGILSEKAQLEKGNIYSFTARVQVSNGSETVGVVFRASNGRLIPGGEVIAKHGSWSLLKGGLVANFSGPVEILLQSMNTAVDIWVDDISLKRFTRKQWRAQQDKIINKIRKGKVKFQVTYANKTALEGAVVSIKQVKSGFPFGCGMNHHILGSTGYQDWFASRFKVTSFTNEMKWYSTEIKPGEENYTVSDAMLKFSKEHGIAVRGHNILWDNPKMQPQWVKDLSPEELKIAAVKRINSVVSRYAEQLIGWDVVNENLHFRFFEDKLGENASEYLYSLAYRLDPKTRMFMNEYNTIERSSDETAGAVSYKKKLQEILSYPGNAGMSAGIGLQGHFGPDQPNIAYMRSSLDILASMGLPIWLTEVDVGKGPNQAQYLEEILREGYSHPGVEGIIIFGGPEVAGFDVMTLADKDFENTEVGNLVDNLLSEWKTISQEIVADDEGSSETSLSHGDYTVTVKHPVTNFSTSVTIKVSKEIAQQTVHVQMDMPERVN